MIMIKYKAIRAAAAKAGLNLMLKLSVALLILHASCTGTESRNPRTEILWDHFGVPHIYADDLQAMYYSYGWAQMRNHADLILKLYGQSRGRASEYWGPELPQNR